MPLMEVGGFHVEMAESLTGSIRTCPCPMIILRYSMVGVLKEHLVILKDKPCSRRHWSTFLVYSW